MEAALLARYANAEDDDNGSAIGPDSEPDSESETELPEVLLAAAPAEQGAGLLAELPLLMQGHVVALLAISTPRSVTRRLTTEEAPVLTELAKHQTAEIWGVGAACAVLRGLAGTRRLRRALMATADANQEAAAIIQSHLFDFDDLIRLRTQELQLLLGRIDNTTLA